MPCRYLGCPLCDLWWFYPKLKTFWELCGSPRNEGIIWSPQKTSLGAGTAPYTPLGCCMAASCPCCHALDPAASWFRKLDALLAFFFPFFSPLLLLLGLFAWARASPRSGFPRGEASAAGDGRVTRTGRWHQHPAGDGLWGRFLLYLLQSQVKEESFSFPV